MRTKPPAGLALTGQEVASSNTTLNTLLGGRQKPWMTGTGSNIRPTPRVQVSQRSASSVLPSPAPSEEPSPVHAQDGVANDIHHIENQPPSQIPSGQDQPRQRTMADSRPPDRSLIINTIQSNPRQTPETTQAQQNKRQKRMSSVSSIQSLKSLIPLMEAHIRKTGGWDALGKAVESPRFLLLLDACHNEDYFFIAIHQLLCIWTVDPDVVTNLDGFRDSRVISIAFQLLGQFIRGNEGLSQIHLTWFTQFPSPLKDLLARSDHYRRTLSLVSNFLSKLASERASMLVQCQQRGYPPLVDEMVNRLGLVSPVLQGVYFTSTRRTIGILDDLTGSQMEALFVQDREGHRLLASRYNTAFPPSEREVLERNAWLAEQYLLLRNSQPRRASQTPVPQQAMTDGNTNHTSVNGRSTAVQDNAQQSPIMQQFAHNNDDAPQSPDLAGRFQNLSHQPQRGDSATPRIANAGYVMTGDFPNYHNTEHGVISSIGHTLHGPPQQLTQQAFGTTSSHPSSRGNPNQFPQPILRRNHSQSPLNPLVLRSNDNQSLPSHTMSNPYPSTIQPTQVQKTPLHQQIDLVRQQQREQQFRTYLQPQISQQITWQTPNNRSAVDSRIQNFRPINSTPVISAPSQGPNNVGQINYPYVPLATTPAGGLRLTDRMAHQPSGKWPLDSLIPPNGAALPPQAPNPDMTAIHQANARSPYLVPTDIPSQLTQNDPSRRYYQAVKEFAVGPVTLSRDLTPTTFEFSVPEVNHAKIAKDKYFSEGSPAAREVQRGSLQYRMRCILLKRDEVKTPSDCAVADTVWPPSIFMEINGRAGIEVRRKILHGKDLAVDITPFINLKLINRIRISIHAAKNSQKDLDYAFSVEIVEILQHQQIMDMCLRSQRIPAEQTVNSIKASLSGSSIDDDEISMVVGDLTINLADPFMARIFDIPVRGSSCLHRECFDLETFLITRSSKPKRPHQPSMVDVWKCPLCGRDARPYSLHVDEFLLSIRDSLAERDMLSVKAVAISADGTWRPKPEAQPRKRSASRAGMDYDDDPEGADEGETPKVAARDETKELEVIDLDDD